MKQWVTPYLKQQKGLVMLTLFFGLLGIGSGAMLLFISGYLISKSALRPENIMLIYIPIVAVRAFSIGQAVFLYLERLFGHEVVLRIVATMRTRLFKIIEPQAIFLRSRFQTGNVLGMLSDDIEHLQNLYLRTIFPTVLALVLYTVIIIVFGFFDIVFALMLLFLIGILVFFVPMISLFVTQRRHIAMKRRKNRLYEQLTSAVFGLTDWQASGRTQEFMKNYDIQHDALEQEEAKIQRWHLYRDIAIQITIGIIVVATIIWSSVQAGEGAISPTVIAAFVLMMITVTDTFANVSESVEFIPAYLDSLRRISTIRDNDTSNCPTVSEWTKSNQRGAIELQHVFYRHPNSHEDTISNLSLTIRKRENIALLGKSGTGKSTLINLIAGLVKPSEGSIMINGIKANRSLLGSQIAILNQKPHLFDTTVGNNVRIGRPEATDEEVWDVLHQAQVVDLIKTLPDGIDTPMHEAGGSFSGGERQRIALARVLLQNTPIVIFDEPAIGLDPLTEQALLKTMLQVTKDKTMILVTHHLAAIEQMDRIVFLEDGSIGMNGTHEYLLHSSEQYKNLYELDKGIIMS